MEREKLHGIVIYCLPSGDIAGTKKCSIQPGETRATTMMGSRSLDWKVDSYFRRTLAKIRHRAVLLSFCFLVAGCALKIVPVTDSYGPSIDGEEVSVFGRVTYLIDGVTRLPYAPFRPAIQRPHFDLLRLEDGNPYQTHGVDPTDGSFLWKMQPGHYIVSGIGQGSFGDDYRIVWPRLAFEIKPGPGPVYIGHLQLRGERYEETYTLSSGTSGVSRGVRYQFAILDNLDLIDLPTGTQANKSLIIHRPNMPIGERLVNEWQESKNRLIADIFSSE